MPALSGIHPIKHVRVDAVAAHPPKIALEATFFVVSIRVCPIASELERGCSNVISLRRAVDISHRTPPSTPFSSLDIEDYITNLGVSIHNGRRAIYQKGCLAFYIAVRAAAGPLSALDRVTCVVIRHHVYCIRFRVSQLEPIKQVGIQASAARDLLGLDQTLRLCRRWCSPSHDLAGQHFKRASQAAHSAM